MILPKASFSLLLLAFSVEASPFLNTNFHPSGVRQVVQNFNKPYAAQYPSLRASLRGSPGIFSGIKRSPVHQPSLRFADTLRRIRERSPLTSRPLRLKNATNSRYLNNFNQDLRTAENIQRFGLRVRDAVQHLKNGRGKITQQANELFDRKFNLGEARNRLQQALLGKKALMKKLHSIGWRGKYVGVPFHTMNDEHMIVKKPGANFVGLVPGSNVQVPFVSPVPAIEPIRPKHPVVPELTTSVDSEQVLEIPAAVESFVFPITSTTEGIPKTEIDNEAIEIANSIHNDRLTVSELPSNAWDRTDDGKISTTPSMYTTTWNGILELIANRMPFIEIKEPTEEADVLFRSENEAITDSNIDAETTTGIVSTLFSGPSTVLILETDASSSMPSTFQTTTPVDVLSRIRLDYETNSVTELDILSTEIPSTSSFISTEADFVTIDKEFTSSTIDAEITTEILLNFSHDSDVGRTSSDETSLSESALSLTTADAGETSTVTDTVFTSSIRDSGSSSESISTLPSMIQTEITIAPDEGSSTIDTPLANSMTDFGTTTDLFSTYSSMRPNEIATSLNEMSTTTEPQVASSEIHPQITTEVTPTVQDFTVAIESTNLYETSTIVNMTVAVFDDLLANAETTNLNGISTTTRVFFPKSATDMDTTTEDVSTYFSTESTISHLVEISTVPNSPFDNSAVDGTATTEFLLTHPSTVPSEITTNSQKMSTASSTSFESSTIDAGTTTEVIPTVEDLIANAGTTNLNGISTTTRVFFPKSATDMDTTTEDFSTYSSTESTISQLVEISTIPNLPSDNSAVDAETTTELIHPSTVPSKVTTNSPEMSTASSTSFESSTIDAGTTTEVIPTVEDLIANAGTTNLNGISTTTSVFSPKTATDMETTIEDFSTYSSTESTISHLVEISTVPNLPSDNSAVDAKTTTELIHPSSVPSKVTTNSPEMSTASSTSFESSTIDAETTTEVISTVEDLIANAGTTNLNGISTTTSVFSPKTATDMEATIEDFSTYSSTESTISQLVEISTIPNSSSDNSAVDGTATTEFFLTHPSTVPSEITTNSQEMSTASSTSFESSTIDAETTTEVIPTVEDLIANAGTTNLNGISTTTSVFSPKSATDMETTTEDFSTYSSTESTISQLVEISTIPNLPSDNSAVDAETTTELIHPSTVPSKVTTNSPEMSTASSTSFESSTIDAETTTEVIPTVEDLIANAGTTNLNAISTTTSVFSPKSATDMETITEDFSTYSSTESTISQLVEISTIPNSSSDNSAVDAEPTTEIVSTYFSTGKNKMTSTLEETFTTPSTASASSTLIASDATTQAVLTYPSTISSENVMLIDAMLTTTDAALTSSTTHVETSETTTDSVSTLSVIIPTDYETTEEHDDRVQNLGDRRTIEDNDQDSADNFIPRTLESVSPQLADTNEDELDEKTLLNLIPLIITELRQGNLSPEERHTLSQGFGDLWPLMIEESKRKSSERMNQNLAAFLIEAGQQLLPADGPVDSLAIDDLQ